MANFKLTIEYDGTGYHGWQRQKNQKTLQGEIEKALATMVRQPVKLIGSGRTDAGVHALGQVASFSSPVSIPAEAYHKGLNSLLPDDIVIHECTPAPPDFHARYDAIGKRYHYRLLNREIPSALERRYVWHIRKPLDRQAMRRAARHLIGEHDFKAFEGAGSPRAHTVRHMVHADVVEIKPDLLVFEIKGSGFLRFMVRNIVSTLVNVGLDKMSPDGFREVLLSRNRSKAGATAPPQGLFLMSVTYDHP